MLRASREPSIAPDTSQGQRQRFRDGDHLVATLYPWALVDIYVDSRVVNVDTKPVYFEIVRGAVVISADKLVCMRHVYGYSPAIGMCVQEAAIQLSDIVQLDTDEDGRFLRRFYLVIHAANRPSQVRLRCTSREDARELAEVITAARARGTREARA